MLLNKLFSIILFSLLSLNVFAAKDWNIINKEGKYLLESPNGVLFQLDYTGIAKFEKAYQKGNYNIIEYYAGEMGTSNILKVHNRVIIDEKEKRVILVAPYKYSGEPKQDQPKWNFNLKKKKVKVIDPYGVDINKDL